MSKEALLNRKLIEHEYYKQLFDNYQTQFQALSALYNETETTLECFEELKKQKSDTQIFALVGSRAYIPLIFNQPIKVLIDVGAKYFIEYTIDEAIDFLNRKKKRITDSMENVSKIIQELSIIIARLEKEISDLSEEIKK